MPQAPTTDNSRPALYIRCLLCRGSGRVNNGKSGNGWKFKKCPRCGGTGEPPMAETQARAEVAEYAELLMGMK